MKRGLLLLFIILSVCVGAQQLPPPPAMSNLEQKRLIDEFIDVSNYKEALTNYAKFYLELKMFDYDVSPPKELITKEQAQSIINNLNFEDFKISLYSSLSFISQENLKELIQFHKKIGGQLSKNNSVFLITPTIDLNLKNQLDYMVENIKK
ncbi:hypothetical protein [Elizabethkingia meningoseptica]|uniref:hypothetical protein n=1 Tax=Elizabethkingia meningoseptica TaxID=238 RepID=UPI0023AFE59F|nr:hypothetical protein [Elizabethkingia meningoseptica]MDE5430545.1 hypothetical protein [Elizabethkingia meningoseptica]